MLFQNEKNMNDASIYTRCGKGDTYCHYYYNNGGGLRFSKTTFNYWRYNIVDDYIKVNNDRNMTVEKLLDDESGFVKQGAQSAIKSIQK